MCWFNLSVYQNRIDTIMRRLISGKYAFEGCTQHVTRGFTLLEVLLAVAVSGLIAVILLSAFRTGNQVLLRSTLRASERQSTIDGAVLLRSWISSAYPLDVNRSPTFPLEPLIGSSSQIEMSTRVTPGQGQNDLYRSRIMYASQNQEVLVEIQPDRFQIEEQLFSSSNIVSDNIASMDIAYLEPGSSASTPSWVNNWQGRSGLPQAIRIQFQSMSGEQVPDLFVRPLITGRMTCVFDPIPRRCR